jgi:hypothetical protein
MYVVLDWEHFIVTIFQPTSCRIVPAVFEPSPLSPVIVSIVVPRHLLFPFCPHVSVYVDQHVFRSIHPHAVRPLCPLKSQHIVPPCIILVHPCRAPLHCHPCPACCHHAMCFIEVLSLVTSSCVPSSSFGCGRWQWRWLVSHDGGGLLRAF